MTRYTATGTFTKVAWIRDPDVPPGQAAEGSFTCPCGGRVEGVSFGQPGIVHCPRCGQGFDGHGWLQ
jgi:hypothetical protein